MKHHPKRGWRLQSKDITDGEFLAACAAEWARERRNEHKPGRHHWVSQWVTWWNLRLPFYIPDALILAKARRLMDRGFLDGCGCGCRGDLELTPKAATALGLSKPDWAELHLLLTDD